MVVECLEAGSVLLRRVDDVSLVEGHPWWDPAPDSL